MTISATTAKRLAYVENFPQVTEQSFLAKRTCPHVVSSLQPSDVLSSVGPVCIKITLFYTILNYNHCTTVVCLKTPFSWRLPLMSCYLAKTCSISPPDPSFFSRITVTEACAGAGTGTWIGNLGSQVVAVVKAKGKKHLLIHFRESDVLNRSTSIKYVCYVPFQTEYESNTYDCSIWYRLGSLATTKGHDTHKI